MLSAGRYCFAKYGDIKPIAAPFMYSLNSIVIYNRIVTVAISIISQTALSFLVFNGFGTEMDRKEEMKNIDIIITLWLGMCIVLIYELVPYLGL